MGRQDTSANNRQNTSHYAVDTQAFIFNPVLQRSPLFSRIDKDIVRMMLPMMRREHWPKNHYLNTQHALNERFYILLNGRIKIAQQHANNGKELTLFLLGPGDGFNVLCLIDEGGRNSQLTTLDEVDVLSASIHHWKEWMDQYSVVRHAVEEYAAAQIQHLSDLAAELALEDTLTRLVHMILRYTDTENHPQHCNLIKDLSQEELAHMIGTVRPVLARLIGQLKREKLIEVERGEMRILNYQRLLEKINNE